MNYTLNQLQIFLKVVEHESITKASEELFLTQPAVSIQIKNFQNQFDVALLEQIGRKIYVTKFGREVANSCQKILDEVNELEYRKMAYLGELVGKLDISVVSTGKYVMPYFLSGFMKKNPGVQLNMDVTNKGHVVRTLEKNEVDFALVSVIPQNLPLERIQLMKNILYLVRQSDGTLPNKPLASKDLEKFPLIFRESGSATRQAMESYISSNNLTIQKSIELTSNEAVKQAVLAGLGYSIMPLIGLHNELLNKEIDIIPMRKLPITTHWNLVWLKGKSFSPVAKAFLNYVEEEKDHIIKETFAWYEKY